MTEQDKKEPKKFIGIMFDCCGVYGRLYPNKEGTAYVGRCPRCMRPIKIRIGEGGVGQRFFRGQ